MATGDKLVTLGTLKTVYDKLAEKPRIIVPPLWNAVLGDTLQIFYRGIIEAPDPYIYNIEFICDIGKNMKRYFEVTPEQLGNYPVTIRIRDLKDNILAEATQAIVVRNRASSPDTEINILCVGDSLTSGGQWVGELKRRLTGSNGTPEGDGLSNINFIGTTSANDVLFEGHGGWTWAKYVNQPSTATLDVWFSCPNHDKDEEDQHSQWQDANDNIWQIETIETNRIKFTRGEGNTAAKPSGSGTLYAVSDTAHASDISYTSTEYDSSNPFWDSDSNNINFSKYCETNHFGQIDRVITLLTWNGLLPYLTSTTTGPIATHVNNAKTFLRKLHTDFPNAVVILMGVQCPSINGGMGTSYGASGNYSNWYGMLRTIMTLNTAYAELANDEEFVDWVMFTELSSEFDSEYNMPQKSKNVNTRNSSVQEAIGTNGVHPNLAGFYQIADAAYRGLVSTMQRDPK